MARKISVEIVGDSRSLEQSFTRASRSASHFNRDIERTFRGVVSGSAVFHGLGRSVAFASTEFLGAAGFVAALKSTFTASIDSQRLLGQTEVALTRSGQSWARYGKQIETVSGKQSAFSGFSQESLLKSFLAFDRVTGSVAKGLRLNALASDVARGENVSLEKSTRIVIRALLGQGSAVQRLAQIRIPKGASAFEILTILQDKFAGSAAKFGESTAGGIARFEAAIRLTQISLGKQLLPTLDTFLDRANDWLGSTKNQERLQHDLASTISTTSTVIHELADGAQTVTGALGGVKTTVELLIGLKVASTVAGWATSFANLATSIRRASTAAKEGQIASTVAGGGSFAGLRNVARDVPLLGAAVIATAGAGFATGRAVFGGPKRAPAEISTRDALLAQLSTPRPLTGLGGQPLDEATKKLIESSNRLSEAFVKDANRVKSPRANLAGFNGPQPGTFATTTGLELAAARAATTKTVADDRAAAEAIRAYARKAIASGRLKGQELIKAFNALASANATLSGLLTKATFTVPLSLQIAEARAGATRGVGDDKAAAAATKAFAEKQISSGKVRGAALIDAFNAIASANSTIDQKVEVAVQQFTIPLDLQIAAAKAGTTAAVRDDEQATKAIRGFTQRAIASGKLKGQALVDAFNELAQLNQQINDTLNQKIDQLRGQFGGLFQGPVLAPTDADTKRKLGVPGPTAAKLTADLAAQNRAFAAEQRDLARLRRRGAPTQLIGELEAQGAGGAQFVHTLATASAKTLNAFLRQFAVRETQISKAARVELRANTVTLHAARVNVTRETRPVAQPVVQHNTVVINDARDSAAVARNTAEHLQRRAKGNVTQRRGRNPGTNRGLA